MCKMNIYIIYIYKYIFIKDTRIYVYIYRERERERNVNVDILATFCILDICRYFAEVFLTPFISYLI